MAENGDKIQLTAVATAANSMGESAEEIKTILNSLNGVILNDINSGAGVWDGQSAAAFVTKFEEASEKIRPICDQAMLVSNNIKTAAEKMLSADGSLAASAPTGGGGRPGGPTAAIM